MLSWWREGEGGPPRSARVFYEANLHVIKGRARKALPEMARGDRMSSSDIKVSLFTIKTPATFER